MIEHKEEEENVGHSGLRAFPTGCVTMLGWRQLSHTPDHAAVNVTQGNIQGWGEAVFLLQNIQQTRIGLFSSLTYHLKEVHRSTFCYN